MGPIRTAMANMAGELAGIGGLNVVTDPAAINPPCAVIEPPRLARLTGCDWDAQHRVHLVAPAGVGSADALNVLDEMLDAITAAGIDPDAAEPTTYILPATGEPAPALTLTFERTTA